MNDRPEPVTRPKPSGRALAFAAAYGTVVATIAYLVAGGNPFWMLVVMIIIGVLFRLYAYRLIRHRGHDRTRWWRWRSRAFAPAAARSGTPSLNSTFETWFRTVLDDL